MLPSVMAVFECFPEAPTGWHARFYRLVKHGMGGLALPTPGCHGGGGGGDRPAASQPICAVGVKKT